MSEQLKLLVIVDPSHDHHLALERAIVTPKIMERQPSLHIFIGADPQALTAKAGNPNLSRNEDWLHSITDSVKAKGLEYTIEFNWSNEWQDAILASAKKFKASHIFMPDFQPGKKRSPFSKSQWALMRKSPCPVTIVRPGNTGQQNIILAAVNMQNNGKAKYAKLNEKILSNAMRLARIFGAELFVVNAYSDSLHYPDREKILKITKLPTHNVHVGQGSPANVIAKYAQKVGADTIIIGTLARTGAKALLKGNTAEKVIKKLEQDVIIYSS